MDNEDKFWLWLAGIAAVTIMVCTIAGVTYSAIVNNYENYYKSEIEIAKIQGDVLSGS